MNHHHHHHDPHPHIPSKNQNKILLSLQLLLATARSPSPYSAAASPTPTTLRLRPTPTTHLSTLFLPLFAQHDSSLLSSPPPLSQDSVPFPAPVLPPLPQPHTLRHSISDLNHSPAKTSSHSSTSSQDFHFSTDLDTPDSKRLRRMKDRLTEMSPWCQQLMREEDLMEEDEDREEQAVEEEQVQIVDDTDQDFHDNATATTEDDGGKDFAESVSVEKKDDCLVIHFRCHCDKAYQFLLSGGDCYYKLM